MEKQQITDLQSAINYTYAFRVSLHKYLYLARPVYTSTCI